MRYYFWKILIVSCCLAFSSLVRADWCSRNIAVDAKGKNVVRDRADRYRNSSPTPVKNLKTEGLLPGEGIRDASEIARKDFDKIIAFSYDWKLNGNRDSLSKAAIFIKSWTDLYEYSINPIDEANFDKFFEGYSIVRANILEADRKSIDNWIVNFGNAYFSALNDIPRKKSDYTNWNSHRLLLAFSSAASVNDYKRIEGLRKYFNEQIFNLIDDKGETNDFKKRDSIHYVVYGLTPLVKTVLISRKFNFLSENSDEMNRLKMAIDWLLPYIDGTVKHIEFEHTSVFFDKKRAKFGLKEYENHEWDPQDAKNLFQYAAYVDGRYEKYCDLISCNKSAFVDSCYGTH